MPRLHRYVVTLFAGGRTSYDVTAPDISVAITSALHAFLRKYGPTTIHAINGIRARKKVL